MSRLAAEFRKHAAAEPGVLDEAILALVASHLHMRDGVEPQARRVAARDAAIEQLDAIGNLGKHRLDLVVEQFEPGDLGVAQVDDHVGALGRRDARLTQGVTQRALGLARLRRFILATSPHLYSRTLRRASAPATTDYLPR